MKIILKSILVSLFILLATVNSNKITNTNGQTINIFNADQVFETMTHDSNDDSNIIIFTDKDDFHYVRKISKSFETVWETKLKKAPEEDRSISIIVDSITNSIIISGTFILDDNNVVLVMRLDSKQGKIQWITDLGSGFQNGSNNIGLNTQNKSIFTIKNRENDNYEVNMHLIKLDYEKGFVLKRNVKNDIFDREYYQYESIVVNSNAVYVLESYYDNYGGRDMTIRKFNKNLELSKEIKFSFFYASHTRMILNENNDSIYLGYNALYSKGYNKFIQLDSDLNIILKIKFEEDKKQGIMNNLSAITLNNKDNSLVYISTVEKNKDSPFQVFLNELSSNGDVIFEKPLQFNEENLPKAIIINNDGSILLAGNDLGKGYLLKVDEHKL